MCKTTKEKRHMNSEVEKLVLTKVIWRKKSGLVLCQVVSVPSCFSHKSDKTFDFSFLLWRTHLFLYASFRWRSALLWRTFFTTAVVAVVLRALIEFCRSGKCGLFGQGGLIMFDVNSSQATYDTPDLLTVIFLGIVGGIFGSLYNFLVDKVLRTYSIFNEYALIIPLILMRILLVTVSPCKYASIETTFCKIFRKKKSMNFYPSYRCGTIWLRWTKYTNLTQTLGIFFYQAWNLYIIFSSSLNENVFYLIYVCITPPPLTPTYMFLNFFLIISDFVSYFRLTSSQFHLLSFLLDLIQNFKSFTDQILKPWIFSTSSLTFKLFG